MVGNISNIQTFSLHDGPGIRTTVFMKGCDLKCFWCHNPEAVEKEKTIAFHAHKCIGCNECLKVCPCAADGKLAFFGGGCIKCGKCGEVCFAEAIEVIGREVTVDYIVQKLMHDKSAFLESGGGVTFSGGEPLKQADFVAEVMKACKEHGIHTAIESAMYLPFDEVEKILPYCDYFICDLKSANSQKHKQATGIKNEIIIENLKKLAATGKLKEICTPVIPGFNDTKEDIAEIFAIVKSFGGDIKYTLLPFHNICKGKYQSQGKAFGAENLPEPTKEQMKILEELIQER